MRSVHINIYKYIYNVAYRIHGAAEEDVAAEAAPVTLNDRSCEKNASLF